MSETKNDENYYSYHKLSSHFRYTDTSKDNFFHKILSKDLTLIKEKDYINQTCIDFGKACNILQSIKTCEKNKKFISQWLISVFIQILNPDNIQSSFKTSYRVKSKKYKHIFLFALIFLQKSTERLDTCPVLVQYYYFKRSLKYVSLADDVSYSETEESMDDETKKIEK
jgi:hypothetical protein